MNALGLTNYISTIDSIHRKQEDFQRKIKRLSEEKQWHTIDALIRYADAVEAPISKLREIILDVSKAAAEKMDPFNASLRSHYDHSYYDDSFDYINQLFSYWKGIAGVKKDKEMDYFIKTLEVAFKLDKIDNKKFYTPEMHVISDLIEAEADKINPAKFAARRNLPIISGYALMENLKQILIITAKKKDGFFPYKLYEEVKNSLHNKSYYGIDLEESLKGYLFAFTINKLLKKRLIKIG